MTICGLHAPYTAADEFAAVLVRSGFDCSPAHALANIHVDSLAEQVLRGAGKMYM